jgi:hypothetical protein
MCGRPSEELWLCQKCTGRQTGKDLASTYVLRPCAMSCPYFGSEGQIRNRGEKETEQLGIENNLIFKLRNTSKVQRYI